MPEPVGLAMAALNRKERSVAETAELLRSRGVGEEEVAAAVSHLTEIGALDDERFARRYAEDKRELAGWGPDRIRSALAERGVAEGDVEAAVAGDSHEAQLSRAASLLEARERLLETEADRESALGFLARRGYPLELAYDAVRRCERERP